MITDFRRSENKACQLVGISRSSFHYQSILNNDETVIKRLKELAQVKRRYGCRRLHFLLRKEGLVKNHKRTERLYRAENLSIRTKKRKKIAGMLRLVLPKPEATNQIWVMDFISDSLWNGRRFRCLTIVDQYSRECLEIKVDTSISGRMIVEILNRLKDCRGLPGIIVVDNGPEFTSRAIDEWAYRNGVKISYIRPGKPIENAYAESFQGRLRDECLNEHWFLNLEDAKTKIENWRWEYNHDRPHSGLKMLSPMEFVEQEKLTVEMVKL